jgi:hypothetical protein
MIKRLWIVSILTFCLYPNLVTATTDIFGYFENRFFLLEDPKQSWENIKEKLSLGDYNRLRLKLKASTSEKVVLNVAVDFFSFHGIMTSPFGTAGEGNATMDDTVKIDLDRAYANLYFKKFDLTIGKQRVALGVSYLWAPLDIFNRVNILEPKEEKPGTNALKIYVPLGGSSSFTGIFAPDTTFNYSKSGVRLKTQISDVDMAVTFIRSGLIQTSVYGIDLRGENFIGWWLEGGYFVTPEQKDFKLVIGFDYTFPIKTGLYWLNEFYYDSSGEKEVSQYNYETLLSGDRFTLGRKYFFSMLRYNFSDFFTASISYIGNWGDGSYIISPTLQYEISQNVFISSGFYFPLGKGDGEFKNNKQNVFFIWLKVNF